MEGASGGAERVSKRVWDQAIPLHVGQSMECNGEVYGELIELVGRQKPYRMYFEARRIPTTEPLKRER